jgi:Family of unknown function (DUF6510)
MSSYTNDYLDGNAAAGELSQIFAMDVTAAVGFWPKPAHILRMPR